MKHKWSKLVACTSLLAVGLCGSLASVAAAQNNFAVTTATTTNSSFINTNNVMPRANNQKKVLNPNNSYSLPTEYAQGKPYYQGRSGYLLTTKNVRDSKLFNLTYFDNDDGSVIWNSDTLANVMDIKLVQNSTSTPYFAVVCATQTDNLNFAASLWTISADTGKILSKTRLPASRSSQSLGLYQFSGQNDNQFLLFTCDNLNVSSRLVDSSSITLNSDGSLEELKTSLPWSDDTTSSAASTYLLGMANLINQNKKKYSVMLLLNSLNSEISFRIYEEYAFKFEYTLTSINYADQSGINNNFIKTLCNQFYITDGANNTLKFAWIKGGDSSAAFHAIYNIVDNQITKVSEVLFTDSSLGTIPPVLLNVKSINFSNNIFYVSSTFTGFKGQEPVKQANVLEIAFDYFRQPEDFIWSQNNTSGQLVKFYTTVINNVDITKNFITIPLANSNFSIIQESQLWILNPESNNNTGGYGYRTAQYKEIKTHFQAPSNWKNVSVDELIINDIENILKTTDFTTSLYSSFTNYREDSTTKISVDFSNQEKYKLRGEITFKVYLTNCYLGGNLTDFPVPALFVLSGFRGWETQLKSNTGLLNMTNSPYQEEFIDNDGHLHLVVKKEYSDIAPEDYDINPLVDLLYKETSNFFVDLPENFIARDDIYITLKNGTFGKTKTIEVHLNKYVNDHHDLVINHGDEHFFSIIIDGLKADLYPLIFIAIGTVCILIIIIAIIAMLAKSKSDKKYEKYIPMLEELSSHDKWA